MPEPTTVLATITGLAKLGTDIASAKDEAERNKLLIEFQKSVIAANFQVATLQQDVSTLKGTIEDLKRDAVRKENWESESKRYVLYKPFSGVVVYALKEGMSNGEPAHYLCANCFNEGQRTLLYFATVPGNNRDGALACKSCKTFSPTGYRPGGSPQYPEGS